MDRLVGTVLRPAGPERAGNWLCAWRARLGVAIALAGCALGAGAPAAAQVPVTEAEARDSALRALPRLRAASADSALAAADVRGAAEYPNPALALGYSRDPPNYHLELEQELEYPWVRSSRIQAARAALDAASLRLELARAQVRYEVAAAYAAAAAARQLTLISARQAADGAEVVRIARQRRDAGDASDLDVDLASLSAAQLTSSLLADSLRLVTATLSLQAVMGLPVDSVRIVAMDTLPGPASPPAADTLAVAAGEAEQRSAERRLAEQRRARLPAPALRFGVEQGDPSGESTGALPTAGVSIPLPLFHRNGSGVAAARAALERAAAELAQARVDAALAITLAARTQSLAEARLATDRAALASARQAAARALVAYREGAYALTAVLEAQRSAFEAERQVLEDVAAVRTAIAAVALARSGGVQP